MKTYIAIGQVEGAGVWHYSFATHQEAQQFVKAANALELPDHEAYRITWDMFPLTVGTVEQALNDIKATAEDMT